jgi:maltose O-acetyltransferase
VTSFNHSKRYAQFAFGAYTYFERIFWFLVNLLPKFLRKIFYKLVFQNFGNGVFIDEGCYFRYPWKIIIRDNVTINRGCSFYPSIKNKSSVIEIHEGSIIAPRVTFFGAGQDPKNPSELDVSEDIIVMDNVYIGGNSTIRYGVTIGSNSIVGSGSNVVKNVAEKVIVAGNPAVQIGVIPD